jgi:hypothetical protein
MLNMVFSLVLLLALAVSASVTVPTTFFIDHGCLAAFGDILLLTPFDLFIAQKYVFQLLSMSLLSIVWRLISWLQRNVQLACFASHRIYRSL